MHACAKRRRWRKVGGADKPGGWRERESRMDAGRRKGRRNSAVNRVRWGWGGKKRRADRQKFDILKIKTTAIASRIVFSC